MPALDDDAKAILHDIIATSENPLADIMANIVAGKVHAEQDNKDPKPVTTALALAPAHNPSTRSRAVHSATCDACNSTIVGIRHKCTICDDFDLCDTCYDARAEVLDHKSDHEMRHIERPTRPIRPRSDSNSSDDSPSFFRFLAAMAAASDGSKAGPTSSKPEDGASEGKEDSEKKPESLVEQVKRQKLDQYERPFLESIVDTDQIATDFGSVYVPEEIVDTLRSLVSLPLLCPQEFQCGILKQHTMSGALLFGPPGTGKTLFAKALAKESGANMMLIKPSDIMDKYVGESEKLVRGLFKLARRLHPCVVFIDELDALFGARTHAGQQSSARWHTSMLTEFMQEMDGLMTSKVVVIGATNRPFDLDDAVLRRLPCRVLIDLPDKPARQEILKIMLREEALAEDVKLDRLADMTDRFSGSDLKNLCLAAAFNAVKDNTTVPWKTASKKGKERGPGESAFVRPVDKPYASITPVPEHTGASIVEVTETTGSEASPGDTASDSASSTTPASTETSTEASSDPSSAEPAPESKSNSPFVSSRVLTNEHFTRALTQVGASSSDAQSTLGEIRTWNTKFGSGGNKLAGILGGGRTGVPPFNPSSAAYNPSSTGTSVPGLGARPGGSSLFGGSGSGVPAYGASGTGAYGGSGSGMGMGGSGMGMGGSGMGLGGSGMGMGGSGMGMGGSGMGMGGSGMGMGGSGMGGSGMGGSGMGGSGMGFPSSTGTSLPGITGTGLGTGLPRFDPPGGRENMSRFEQGGAGGNSMGYTGPGGSGAGTGISTYGGGGGRMNFGGGMRPGGGDRDMPWHQRPGSGLGLGSDDLDMASIAAVARQMGMGGGAGMGLSGEGGLGKAVDA